MPAAVKSTRKDAGRNRYLALVRQFPLRPLRSDRELSEAIKMIDSLIVRGDLNSARAAALAFSAAAENLGITPDENEARALRFGDVPPIV